MTVEALTMSAQAAKPTEGQCRERHVLSVVMENKPLTCDLSRQMATIAHSRDISRRTQAVNFGMA
jgi:hypothetical protein